MMKFFKKILIAASIFFCSTAAFAGDNSPVVILNHVSQQMIGGLEQNKSKIKSSPKIIDNLVEKYIVPHIDIDRMTGSILGRGYWTKASSAQKKQLITELQKMIIATYSAAFASYDNDKIQFYPLRGDVNAPELQVQSVVVRRSGQKIRVDYNVEKLNGTWMVYDFSIENVSMVQSYRSQFAGTLSQGGVPLLIQQLKAHNQSQGNG